MDSVGNIAIVKATVGYSNSCVRSYSLVISKKGRYALSNLFWLKDSVKLIEQLKEITV